MIHSPSFSFPRPYSTTFALLALSGLPALAQQTKVYTTSADFAQGQLTNVNSTVVADQLQLDTNTAPPTSPFVIIPCSARGTVVRIDAVSGTILGEFRTAPQGLLTNPSRTSVDSKGNVWVGNRDENGLVAGVAKGSVVKIGVVIGGTRVDANGQPNPNGQYLKPPFLYSTAVDRDGDGLIRTSRGLGDILAWPNITDGVGGRMASFRTRSMKRS